jgi:hypothetical protein
MLRTRWPVALFVPWSVFVWVTRIVNALEDDTANKPLAVALALTVLAPAVLTGVVLVQARERPLAGAEVRLWRAFAGWSSLVWLVRGAEIAVSDRNLDFKIVHVALGAVSIALAAATVGVTRREAAASRDPGSSAPAGGPSVGGSSPVGAGR